MVKNLSNHNGNRFMSVKKYSNCPICSSTSIYHYLSYKDRHYLVTNQEFDLWKCNLCNLIFLNPMPEEKELMALYPKETYYAYTIEKKNHRGILKDLVIKFFKLEPSDLSCIKKADGLRILDFGCGTGWALNAYKEKGYQTYGLELEEKAIEIGERYGHIMINKNIISANFDSCFFDMIRSNHSFEHVVNPVDVILEFKRILKKDGKLFIGVPNAGGLTKFIFGKYWYFLGVPYHPFGYSATNLKLLLEKNGFYISKQNYRSDWQCLLGSMQIYLNRNTNKKSLEGILINFPFKVIATLISKVFDLLRIGDSIEIVAIKK